MWYVVFALILIGYVLWGKRGGTIFAVLVLLSILFFKIFIYFFPVFVILFIYAWWKLRKYRNSDSFKFYYRDFNNFANDDFFRYYRAYNNGGSTGNTGYSGSSFVGIEKYYKVLGLQTDASVEEIKKTYKKLVRKYHPDFSQNLDKEETVNLETKLKEINEAYDNIKRYKKF